MDLPAESGSQEADLLVCLLRVELSNLGPLNAVRHHVGDVLQTGRWNWRWRHCAPKGSLATWRSGQLRRALPATMNRPGFPRHSASLTMRFDGRCHGESPEAVRGRV